MVTIDHCIVDTIAVSRVTLPLVSIDVYRRVTKQL